MLLRFIFYQRNLRWDKIKSNLVSFFRIVQFAGFCFFILTLKTILVYSSLWYTWRIIIIFWKICYFFLLLKFLKTCFTKITEKIIFSLILMILNNFFWKKLFLDFEIFTKKNCCYYVTIAYWWKNIFSR